MDSLHIAAGNPRRRESRAARLAAGVVASIVEIAIAICVGVALVLGMQPSFVSNCPKAPRDIAALCAAIERYAAAHDGRRPLALTDLVAHDADGGYLMSRTTLPLDSWGRPYGYESPTAMRGYRVFTLGRDGQPGGSGDDADIDNLAISARR